MRLLAYPTAGVFLGLLAYLPLSAYADAGQDAQNVEPGFLSEIRVGALRHDAGIFTAQEEDSGIDANIEFLFASPEFLTPVWSPRPHLGATGNFGGETSQAYLGLTWDIDLFSGIFIEFSFGAAAHNGDLDTGNPYRKNLGCRWLFRESGSLGYRISEHHNITLMLDHLSNAYLCDRNDGIDTLGLRWGYRF